jgi:hypothetical protein
MDLIGQFAVIIQLVDTSWKIVTVILIYIINNPVNPLFIYLGTFYWHTVVIIWTGRLFLIVRYLGRIIDFTLFNISFNPIKPLNILVNSKISNSFKLRMNVKWKWQSPVIIHFITIFFPFKMRIGYFIATL